MELKHILEEVPGLSRRLVYYLEARGYINPEKIKKQRIARREYSQNDLEVIKGVWHYYNRGYALQVAYDLATATDNAITYLRVRAPFRTSVKVLERLKDYAQVVEASVVHGTEFDLFLKTDTPDQSEVYHALVPILAELGIMGLPDVYTTDLRYKRSDVSSKTGDFDGMMAYVLLRVPGKDVSQVMEELKAFDAIKEASTVYGESDVVLRVEASDQAELDSLVMKRLHDIPAVESTRTFVVVTDLHWSRS